MKKRFLLLIVLTLILALTGCSLEGNEKLNFDLNQDQAVEYIKALVEEFNEVSDIEYDYYINEGEDIDRTAVSGFRAAQTTDHVGKFVSFDTSGKNVTMKNGARGNVLCSIVCKYENRDVKVTVSFTKNRAYDVISDGLWKSFEQAADQNGVDVMNYISYYFTDYGYDVTDKDKFLAQYIRDQYQQLPFEADECEVSPIYSKSELMQKAGINTAIGMMVVFAVLIFIAFIIYLLRFVPKLLVREITPTKNEAKKEARSLEEKKVVVTPLSDKQAAGTVAAADAGNLMNDGQLVAVITAAVSAYIENTSGGKRPVITDSKDKLIVRSIRRVR